MSDLSDATLRHLSVLDQFRIADHLTDSIGEQWRLAVIKDPALRQAIMTVDLFFGSDTVVRMATQRFESVSGTTGKTYIYLPELVEEPEWERSYTLKSGAAEVVSVSLSLNQDLVKPADIISNRRMLSGYGEICLQLVDGDYDQRIVLIRGEMTGGVSFGASGEDMSLEVSDPKLTSDLIFPPWISSTDRHTDLPDAWVGERYPVVYNGYHGVECIRLTTSTTAPDWLINYGHNFTLDKVYVNGVDTAAGSAATPWAQGLLVDDLGTKYQDVDFSAGTYTWQENDSVHADISATTETGLIGIIEDLVSNYSTLGVQGANKVLFSAAGAKLPRLTPELMVRGSSSQDETGILSFIENTICASFPMISMSWEAGRYGPIVTDYRQKLQATELTSGEYPLIDRFTSMTEVPKEDLCNSFTLKYCFDTITNTYQKVMTRNPSNDALCKLSAEGYKAGVRTMPTIESQFIRTDAEAAYVLDWLVAHLSQPRYYVEYYAWPWVLLWLKRGDSVWFTDPDFNFSAERSVVTRIGYQRGKCVIGFTVWPWRSRRATLRD